MNVPISPEAERSVLGAALIDPDVIGTVSEYLRPEHFYSEKHRIIYRVMLEIDNEGRETDSVSVTEALRIKGKLEEVGSIPYLLGMMDENQGTFLAEQHAALLIETARLRGLQEFASFVTGKVASGITSSEVISEAEQALSKLNEEASEVEPLADAYAHEAESILNEKMGGYVQTGFYNLDRMLGGIKGVTILAARPSQGKSSTARDIARNIFKDGKKVCLLSPDQSGADIFRLEASLRSGIELTRIKSRQYTLFEAEEWKRALATFKAEAKEGMMIDDRPLTLPSLTARFRNAARWGAKVVIIDYLQLVDVPGMKASEEYASVTAVSKAVKRLTRETGVPALVLAQLNRGSEGRSNPRPIMSDLRSSGQIEQDADAIVFIHRPNRDVPMDVEPVEFVIAKQKDGPIGTIHLHFTRKFSTFHDPGR